METQQGPQSRIAAASTATVGVDGQLFTSPRSGIARYTLGLMEATVAASDGSITFDAVVTKGFRPTPEMADVVQRGVRLIQPPLFRSKRLHYGARFGMRPDFSTAVPGADMVLFPNYRTFRTDGLPFVTMIHDLSHRVCPQWLHPDLVGRLNGYVSAAIDRSDLIGTISNSVAAEIEAAYPSVAHKIRVLRPGPSPLFVAPERPPASADYALCVGTIEPRKNILRLIEAAHGRFHLVVAGRPGWSNQAEYEAIAASRWVTLRSDVSDSELAELYAGARVVVQPSHYEGFGLPLLEAMSAGTAVACSDIAIFREVGGAGVAYFDHLDPSSIANTVTSIMHDDDMRHELESAGRKQAQCFSWTETGSLFASLVGDLV